MDWYTIDSIRAAWPDFDAVDDDTLSDIVESARLAVTTYAPALPDVPEVVLPDPVTVNVNHLGVTGTIVLSRLPGDVLELALDLDTSGGTGAYWEQPITSDPELLAAENQLFWSLTDGPTLEYQANGALGRRYGDWPVDDEILIRLYANARESIDPVIVIPANYRQAQLLQARNIWNSAYASPTGEIDGAGFGLTTFPLDWSVQQLLRPKQGKPVLA